MVPLVTLFKSRWIPWPDKDIVLYQTPIAFAQLDANANTDVVVDVVMR